MHGYTAGLFLHVHGLVKSEADFSPEVGFICFRHRIEGSLPIGRGRGRRHSILLHGFQVEKKEGAMALAFPY